MGFRDFLKGAGEKVALGGGKGKVVGGAMIAGLVGALGAGRDKRREKRKERSDRRTAEIEEARLAMANRMPALRSPLLWWIPFILGPIIYAFRTAFRWVFDAAGFVLRPIGTAVSYPIQMVARFIGGTMGVLVILAMILGFIFLIPVVFPPVAVWFVEHGIHDVKDFAVWLASVPGRVSESFSESFKYRMALATGEYWQGEEEGEEVGIFLERVMPMQSRFYQGDPIIVSADLRGSGDFDELDGTLKASCLLIERDSEAMKIYPSNEIELWTLSNSKEGIECEFEPYTKIIEPTNEVRVMIEFPFETTGRVTLTFMDEDTIRQLRRENKDPNLIYNIPSEPVSFFQPGPVMVGLGTVRSNPIGATAGKEILTRLGFTLDNRWEGEIVNITGVEIIVDNGISLPPGENTIKMDKPVSIGEGRTKYTVDTEYLGRLTHSGKDPITTFSSLNFRMMLDRSVLEDTVVSLKEIEVRVKYDYRLWKNTQIQLDYDPWRDENETEETRGLCGSDECSETQKCCENARSGDRACRDECGTPYETDVTDEIRPAEAVECGEATCAEGEVCCQCTEPSRPACQNAPYLCKSECDGLSYKEVPGGTAST